MGKEEDKQTKAKPQRHNNRNRGGRGRRTSDHKAKGPKNPKPATTEDQSLLQQHLSKASNTQQPDQMNQPGWKMEIESSSTGPSQQNGVENGFPMMPNPILNLHDQIYSLAQRLYSLQNQQASSANSVEIDETQNLLIGALQQLYMTFHMPPDVALTTAQQNFSHAFWYEYTPLDQYNAIMRQYQDNAAQVMAEQPSMETQPQQQQHDLDLQRSSSIVDDRDPVMQSTPNHHTTSHAPKKAIGQERSQKQSEPSQSESLQSPPGLNEESSMPDEQSSSTPEEEAEQQQQQSTPTVESVEEPVAVEPSQVGKYAKAPAMFLAPQWDQEEKPVAKKPSIVEFNVGGEVFKVHVKTLDNIKDSMLWRAGQAFVDDTDQDDKSQDADSQSEFLRDESNAIFFDRDPVLFRTIINFIRTGTTHLPSPSSIFALRQEAEFFGVPQAVDPSNIHPSLNEQKVTFKRSISACLTSWNQQNQSSFVVGINAQDGLVLKSYKGFGKLMYRDTDTGQVHEVMDCSGEATCSHTIFTPSFDVDANLDKYYFFYMTNPQPQAELEIELVKLSVYRLDQEER